MNQKSLTILVVLMTKMSWAIHMDFVDCGTVGILYYVDIQGCYNDPETNPDPGEFTADEKCIVERGASIHGEVQFEAGSNSEYLDCEIWGIINGLEEPFPGACTPTGDVCLDLAQGDCPIEAGEIVLYNIDMSVLPSYPTIDGQAKWTLLNEWEDMVLCFEVDIQILP